MSPVWFRTLLQHGLILVAGGLIGWLYGGLLPGLLVATVVLLVWHIYHLYLLERWLRRGKSGPLPAGNGPWPQVIARIKSVQQRARDNRRTWTSLAKEIRASIKAFPDGGVVLSKDLEIIRCNKTARQLLGLKKKRDRGIRIDNLIRHPDFVHYLKHSSKQESVEIPGPTSDDVWLSCRLVTYGMDQRLLLVRDISEHMKIARVRRDFAANASHELRTPLTVITGYLDAMAEDEALPNPWRGPVADMQEQADRMQRLVQDLLQLATLESATSCSRDNAVDIAAILLNAQRNALALFDRPEHIDLALESDASILGEESELQSVVSNLVSNAVHYTPSDGSITISWRADHKGGHLQVSDTGIGVPADEISRLTERFYRTDSGRARQQGGTGLGLAIVKHALIRHDAKLEVNSEIGVGSQFTCHFPSDRLMSK